MHGSFSAVFDIGRPLEVEFVGCTWVNHGDIFFNLVIDGIREDNTLRLFEAEHYLLPSVN